MPETVRMIKGHPGGKDGRWDDVQAIQHEPFIFVMYNGHHSQDKDEDEIPALLAMLRKYRLREDCRGKGCYTVNPCTGVRNPRYPSRSKQMYIDGPRMYAADGVVHFSGNFENYAYAFGIDTNHKPTIDALMDAIRRNSKLKQ